MTKNYKNDWLLIDGKNTTKNHLLAKANGLGDDVGFYADKLLNNYSAI